MSYNTGIAYPFVTKGIPGILDAEIVVNFTNSSDMYLNPPKVTSIRRVITETDTPEFHVTITFSLSEYGFTDADKTFSIEVKTDTLEIVHVTKQIESVYELIVYAYIRTLPYLLDTFFNEQKTNVINLEVDNELEPCTVTWLVNHSRNINYIYNYYDKEKDTYEPIGPVVNARKFGDGISLSKLNTGDYLLEGKSPTYEDNFDRGIKSVNGLFGDNISINVSQSLLLVADSSKHTITITGA